MKNAFNFISLLLIGLFITSTNSTQAERPGEVINNSNRRIPNQARQEYLRALPAWQSYTVKHNTWRVHFNEQNGKPHRAYGKGILTSGASVEDRAMNFITSELGDFNIPVSDLRVMGISNAPKHHYVNYYQEHNGLKVLDSRMMVKMTKDYKVINFGADVFDDIEVGTIPALSSSQAAQAALNATEGSGLTSLTKKGLFILPIARFSKNEYRLVYEVIVDGKDPQMIPSSFYTLVDALNGDVLRQFNMSHTHAPKANVEATVTADIYPQNAYDTPVNMPLQEMRVRINGTDYYTDAAGLITTSITSATSGTFFLEGPWAEIRTSGNVPSFSSSLSAGPNAISFNSDALDTERNAFYHINQIHAWVNSVLAGFNGMDYQVTVNMDQTGTCNASFGGGQMNFFLQGGGCYSLATVGDVVYHEYGHGINTAFYNDNGGFFQNGAMGEAYSDVWGFSITEYPVLGEGMSDTDPAVYIRRYDIDPKIYPDDLVGQVHADGEILAGSWWDLYLNLGNNMTLTMDLFEDAYYGLQAQTPDGQEGQAFRDVLLDVLDADDTDGNLSNGTPNMTAICDAFGQHGITLISNATLTHTEVDAAATGLPINIDATLNLSNTTYLGDVMLYYRLQGSGTWINVVMSLTGGSNYQGIIPSQNSGAIVEYYIGVTDNTCGNISAVQPIGADAAEPTLPYYILVDYQLEEIEDFDNNSFSGAWTYGIPSDLVTNTNGTSGRWSLEFPEGMYDNGYELAPTTQATPGGFSCAVTQKNTDANNSALIGEFDVDGGATTLITPPLDLTGYSNPVFTYKRWFSNASPSSANPGNDPWYVEITSDGSTWIPIEFTYVGDANWRRYAFNALDYITLSANVQLKFQVSDSVLLTLGPPGCGAAPFCGGSLLEAALDDVAVWSQMSTPGGTVTTTVTNSTCNATCDGQVAASASGGTAPYQYLWDDPAGQTSATATGLCSGTFEVRTVDASNDTIYATAVISVLNPDPVPTISSTTLIACNGNCDGQAEVSTTMGAPSYTYLWSNAQTTTSISLMCAGSYTVTVTDANGCVGNTAITITQPGALGFTSSVTDANCGFSDGVASVTVSSGVAPYTYLWSDPGAQATAVAIGLSATNYSCLITDANGCTITANMIVNNTGPTVSVLSSTNATCNGDNDGAATALATLGATPYTYVWNDPLAQTGATAINLAAGTYSVTATDASGCLVTDQVTIAEPASISLIHTNTDASCTGACDGVSAVAVANGITPLTYLWDDLGAQTNSTANGLCDGTFNTIVTDANGCTANASTSLNAGVGITVTSAGITNTTCGVCNGDATVSVSGGSAPYTYLWSDPGTQSNATANNLCAGLFDIVATDAAGCTDVITVEVFDGGGVVSNVNSSDATCNGAVDGSATVSVTGGTTPYTYSWNPGGQTTATANGLAPGTYSITTTDASGCVATSTITITEPDAIVLSSSSTNAACGNSNGVATVSPTGGTPAYTYSWSDGQTTASATGLSAGIYSVSVTDANGCNSSTSATIFNTGAPTVTANSSSVSCNGGSDGTATASTSGGQAPFTYVWDDGSVQMTQTANGLSAGTYNVTVTDANGCTSVTFIAVNEPIAVTGIATTSNATCGNMDGSATVTASGGNAPYTYLWDDPGAQITTTSTGLGAGNYTATITDVNGCIGTVSVAVSNTGGPTVFITSNDVACNGGSNGLAATSVSGGLSPYTYLWDDPLAQTSIIAQGLSAGTYFLQVTDNLGCSTSETVTIGEPDVLSVIASGTSSTCSSCNNGTATAMVNGGTVPYSYSWNDPAGQTTATASSLDGGSVTCLITDANGCTIGSNTVLVTVGIEERLLKGSVSLFPNPARDIVQLSFAMLSREEVSISVVNYLGKEVYAEHIGSLSASDHTIDFSMSQLASGVYIVKLLVGDQVSSHKVNLIK